MNDCRDAHLFDVMCMYSYILIWINNFKWFKKYMSEVKSKYISITKFFYSHNLCDS